MQKAKDRPYNGGGNEKAAGYYIRNKEFLRENAKNKISIETCLKEKQKENMKEIDIETWQRWKNKLKEYQRKY